MREVAAIVESAVDLDKVTRSILSQFIALQDDERSADAHEKKSASYRESAARRRVSIGRDLIAAKAEIKHGGWMPYLEKLGIDRVRAAEWMREAGHVDESVKCTANPRDVHLSPRVAAGIDKRPRKRDAMPTPDPEPSVVISSSTSTLDISRDLAKLTSKICDFAESLADKRYRVLVANQLRETARLIEEMP